MAFIFFFNDTAPTEIYTLSLHDALPISLLTAAVMGVGILAGGDWLMSEHMAAGRLVRVLPQWRLDGASQNARSEEHTSELQSRENLVCRLLLEKKKKQKNRSHERGYKHQ